MEEELGEEKQGVESKSKIQRKRGRKTRKENPDLPFEWNPSEWIGSNKARVEYRLYESRFIEDVNRYNFNELLIVDGVIYFNKNEILRMVDYRQKYSESLHYAMSDEQLALIKKKTKIDHRRQSFKVEEASDILPELCLYALKRKTGSKYRKKAEYFIEKKRRNLHRQGKLETNPIMNKESAEYLIEVRELESAKVAAEAKEEVLTYKRLWDDMNEEQREIERKKYEEEEREDEQRLLEINSRIESLKKRAAELNESISEIGAKIRTWDFDLEEEGDFRSEASSRIRKLKEEKESIGEELESLEEEREAIRDEYEYEDSASIYFEELMRNREEEERIAQEKYEKSNSKHVAQNRISRQKREEIKKAPIAAEVVNSEQEMLDLNWQLFEEQAAEELLKLRAENEGFEDWVESKKTTRN